MASRIIFVIGVLLLVGAFIVRSSNISHTNQLVASVLQADGGATDTAGPLAAVKSFVMSHLGTHAKFSLTGSYQRDVEAAKAAAAAQATNSQIYSAAQAACGGKTDSITQAKCNAAYLSAHLVSIPASAPVSAPNLSAYQFYINAPFWTPDSVGLLGAFGILTVVGGGVGLIRRRK